MRRLIILTTVLLAVLLAQPSLQAALILTVGDVTLQPDTAGQAVNLFVTSTTPATDPSDVTGVNLTAVLGDGTGPGAEPIFGGGPTTEVADGGVLFSDGPGGSVFIFDAFPGAVSDAPVEGNEQFQISSFTFNDAGQAIQPNGLLATLFVDTTGLSAGTFALTLSGDATLGLPATEFITTGGGTFTPTIVNGALTIAPTAIPEPASIALLLAGVGVSRWRWSRKKRLDPAA